MVLCNNWWGDNIDWCKKNELIFKQYLEIKVIEQSHTIETKLQDNFLYEASKVLRVKGYMLIKKNYMNALLFFS